MDGLIEMYVSDKYDSEGLSGDRSEFRDLHLTI